MPEAVGNALCVPIFFKIVFTFKRPLLSQRLVRNIDIDKLRSIILFEADLNWWMKMIFAHRLIARATEMELLPQEFYAMEGECAKEVIITRTLWTDTN